MTNNRLESLVLGSVEQQIFNIISLDELTEKFAFYNRRINLG